MFICERQNESSEVYRRESGKSQSCVACEFSLAQPTVSSILKNRQSIFALAAKGCTATKRQ